MQCVFGPLVSDLGVRSLWGWSLPALALMLATPFLRAASINVTADPSVSARNSVRNPHIEQGRNGQPAEWRFSTAIPENFETAWRQGGRSGKCLWLKAASGKMSGYWNQSMPVVPGQTYLFRGWYRLGGGRILCYAHGRKRTENGRSVAIDKRFYAGSLRNHWLVPVFLPPDALMGPDPTKWFPFEVKVPVPDGLTAIALSVGMYFTAGEVAYDDIELVPLTVRLEIAVHLGPGEQARRVLVTRTGAVKPILDVALPAGGSGDLTYILPHEPLPGPWHIAVTLRDGGTVEKTFPAQPAEKEAP